jgi:hypothetical protein
VLAYLRVWYADENAVVRHKLYIASIKRFTPWLEEIIRQGVEEGVLTTTYPDQAARVVLSLFEDLGYATAELLLANERSPGLPRRPLMRWSVCWERQWVACSTRGCSLPRDQEEKPCAILWGSRCNKRTVLRQLIKLAMARL